MSTINESTIISIITPVYNIEAYIEKCLISILRQTYPNFELLLIDDGSTDGTSEMCQFYASRDKRISYLYSNHLGVSNARNLAMEHCHGDFITFIDGDDFVKDDYLETLLDKSCIYDADIVISSLEYLDSNKKEPAVSFLRENVEDQVMSHHILRAALNDDLSIGVSGTLFRQNVLKNARFDINTSFSDYGLMLRALGRSNRLIKSTYAGYYYFQRRSSLTHNLSLDSLKEKYISFCNEFKFIEKTAPDLIPLARHRCFEGLCRAIYELNQLDMINEIEEITSYSENVFEDTTGLDIHEKTILDLLLQGQYKLINILLNYK